MFVKSWYSELLQTMSKAARIPRALQLRFEGSFSNECANNPDLNYQCTGCLLLWVTPIPYLAWHRNRAWLQLLSSHLTHIVIQLNDGLLGLAIQKGLEIPFFLSPKSEKILAEIRSAKLLPTVPEVHWDCLLCNTGGLTVLVVGTGHLGKASSAMRLARGWVKSARASVSRNNSHTVSLKMGTPT